MTNIKNLTIVLDAAHGEEVPGKRSPDGKFREYKWSREVIKDLSVKLKSLGYTVVESNPTTKEIGLSKRVANTKAVKGRKIFISIHSDAAGMGKDWMTARGYSIYTTVGQNNSDVIAEIMLKQLAKDIPELKMRADKSDGDLDKESNFTVIAGADCPAVLIEWCFQDNKEDVAILTNPEYNKKLINSLVTSINQINETLK